MLQQLDRRGCTLVDTTCGSVLNVWKNVRRYAEDGFTSIIHGKVWHEETQATASQAVAYGGHYLVVFDRRRSRRRLRLHPRRRRSRRVPGRGSAAPRRPGFDPDRDLQRIGLANQTTMLMSESLEIGEMLQGGDASIATATTQLAERFQAFDTICSATQDRQDAVVALLARPTAGPDDRHRRLQQQQHRNLARICAASRPTFHIADPDCLRVGRPRSGTGRSARRQKSRPAGWLPTTGPSAIGLTSGASTPDNLVGAAILKLAEFCGVPQP